MTTTHTPTYALTDPKADKGRVHIASTGLMGRKLATITPDQLAEAARLVGRANAHAALVAACKAVEVATANIGVDLTSAFVWSNGDGTQSGGYGERIYLLDTIRAALKLAGE